MAAAAGDEQERKTPPALVQIEQVEVHLSLLGPVVLLKVRGKAIPIFVDPVVAESINAALTGQKTHRPLSHDLMRTILRAFDGRVSRVVVTLKGATYYADLTVIVGDSAKVFDSRSSDAIALAVHFKAPILVSQELVDSAGKEVEVPNERRL
ncbi:MAG: bifunctional nuclease family protein [Betaproteobacteria bacterium]|nr:bifunctional nuclease family protein [Betaproteobacteria bacterium]